ncbi:hypothetical protein [Streptomyces candidus]|uniref:Lipoprotein n=1 Tax=Streptomyces candidus TaxID=67283 RepID=A0A7X0HM95_9ACTN|nr:hypothetical protein [Streptomyces candidus]MBB6440058.1 hypothetical protein [Streptomyces candidus]GHH56213.1 hypothetical protein GCM10018773_61850 [Streptomyces candidus]
MTRKTTAAVLAAGVLALAGCSSGDDGGVKGSASNTSAGGQLAPEDDALVKVATRYQEAANRLDWHTACSLSTSRMRDGTVEECAARFTVDEPRRAAPSELSSPSPSISPPTYADGSTPEPVASRTPTGPDRADTGPVSASDVVEVPAVEDHPAGYGVLVTYTVQWPDKNATTTRSALRLVRHGGAWLVDQDEDVQEGDMVGHGSPVRAALSGG